MSRPPPHLLLLGLLGLALGLAPGPARAQAPGGQPAQDGAKLPAGWFVGGNAPHHYEAGVDPAGACEGERSAVLRARTDEPSGYGTFMQIFRADDFRGQRVRFSAMVRTERVDGWAGLFMRVDGPDAKQPLAFDNMQTRALVGTNGCERHDVVLQVPQNASYVALGMILSGTGKVWLSGVRFEPVGPEIAVTDLLNHEGLAPPVSDGPDNLSFTAVTDDDEVTGRVGDVWFTRQLVEGRTRVHRQKDGSWKGVWADVKADGRAVSGTVLQRTVRVGVARDESTTLVQGRWGPYPVRILMTPDELTLRWGARERKLMRDPASRNDKQCHRYVQSGGGPTRVDQLVVCGLALSPTPPPAQLVVSFLFNGFERQGRPLAPVPGPSSETRRRR